MAAYKLTSGWPQRGDGTFVNPESEEYLKFLAGGGVPDPVDPSDVAAAKQAADVAAARAYGKLNALKAMTPAQTQTWVQNNVNTLADAKDAIATLAIAVGILARNV